MSTFVTGILEHNVGEYGLYRLLSLLLASGKSIHIFDSMRRARDGEPISTHLSIGETYEMLLMLGNPRGLTYSSEASSDVKLKVIEQEVVLPQDEEGGIAGQKREKRNYVLQGFVLDPSWQTPEGLFRLSRPDLKGRSFVLLQTAIGNMVMSRQWVEQVMGEQLKEVVTGGYMEWEPSRIDLLAVL